VLAVLYCSTNQCGEISDSLTPGGMLASGLAVCLTRTPRSESQDSYVQYSTVQYVALLDRAHRETTALIEGRGCSLPLVPYPPCSVDTKRMLSLACSAYDASPSSSQSASLMRTRIPGRLRGAGLVS
jgi:hypothetical protein